MIHRAITLMIEVIVPSESDRAVEFYEVGMLTSKPT